MNPEKTFGQKVAAAAAKWFVIFIVMLGGLTIFSDAKSYKDENYQNDVIALALAMGIMWLVHCLIILMATWVKRLEPKKKTRKIGRSVLQGVNEISKAVQGKLDDKP